MPKPAYRTSIVSLVASLASLDREVGPVELCCMWFDDLYFPGHSNPELFNPGVWERGLREWKACFTEQELNALAEFHNVFNVESVGNSMDWPDWDKDPKWLRVRDAAHLAMLKLPPVETLTPKSNDDLSRK